MQFADEHRRGVEQHRVALTAVLLRHLLGLRAAADVPPVDRFKGDGVDLGREARLIQHQLLAQGAGQHHFQQGLLQQTFERSLVAVALAVVKEGVEAGDDLPSHEAASQVELAGLGVVGLGAVTGKSYFDKTECR
ncbi:hypothetical protein D3C84_784210 [compost metagenome]